MEEARQHPALSRLGWLSIAAYAAFFIGSLAVLVSALVGYAGQAVSVLAPIMCVAAIVLNGVSVANAFRTGVVRFGRKLRFSRTELPLAFWTVILVFVAVAAAYAFVFVVITGIGL